MAAEHAAMHERGLGWGFGPVGLLLRWPRRLPLVALLSDGGSEWSRWSVFGVASGLVRVERSAGEAGPARARWIPLRPGARCPVPLERWGSDGVPGGIGAADGAQEGNAPGADDEGGPFRRGSGWIGWLSYGAGREMEPAAVSRSRGRRAVADRLWPLSEFFRCPAVIVHDGRTGRWTARGDLSLLPALGDGEPAAPLFRCAAPSSHPGEDAYQGAVARTVEYTRSGDVFQANIAHRLSARFVGSPRGLAAAMLRGAGAWYGACIESPAGGGAGLRHALVSASPELFLSIDGPAGRIVTRPIKGTRAAGEPGAAAALCASAKDRAELNMIIDLMRNDLGRVCAYGSVRVEREREIERHGGESGGVLHTVATVSGVLRPGVGAGEALRAAFPPGSVTGAPKVRAMQIIDALEPVQRGPYCGCIGFIDDEGRASFSVAIRTAALSFDGGAGAHRARGVVDYHAGAGIVAESDPQREWEETMHKAGVFLGALAGAAQRGRARARPAGAGAGA